MVSSSKPVSKAKVYEDCEYFEIIWNFQDVRIDPFQHGELASNDVNVRRRALESVHHRIEWREGRK